MGKIDMWIVSSWQMNRSNVPSLLNDQRITPERLKEFDDASTALLANRLEEDDYPTPFEGLNDWHLLRALAIHRPELTIPYLHLIDQEPFDED